MYRSLDMLMTKAAQDRELFPLKMANFMRSKTKILNKTSRAWAAKESGCVDHSVDEREKG